MAKRRISVFSAGTSLKAVTNAYSRELELWVGESSNEWTGGLPNRSDVTFDAFFYADQLQTMAKANVSVRKTFARFPLFLFVPSLSGQITTVLRERQSQKTGPQAVVRQDLLGMYYQLLSYPKLRPKPSYW